MKRLPLQKSFLIPVVLLILMSSCKKGFSGDNYVAYFGGEVINPTVRYVLFCKNDEVIDTIKLKADNTFFKKFDSLTPGMYNFKHEPEYQYVFFDKNDSLMVHINTKNFDESVVYCGRGDEKNNFLMEMYLRNENNKDKMFKVFDYDLKDFTATENKTFEANTKYYTNKKQEINWSEEFDIFAKASVDFPHYSKNELYPLIHKKRTGKNITSEISPSFYDFRKKIDYSSEALSNYSPYVMYINHMLDNISEFKIISKNEESKSYNPINQALKINLKKLSTADSLIKNEKLKNLVLNNIAFKYLLEDQNMTNNNLFLDTYYKYLTDRTQKNEIIKLGNAIQLLKPNFDLPKVNFVDINGEKTNSNDLIKNNTVFFFWTESANSHMILVHKKVIELKKKYPNFDFIAINLNDKESVWKETLSKYNFEGIKELHCTNFEDLRNKWAITKIHRTIVVNKNKKIINAFSNIFDDNFEDNLK